MSERLEAPVDLHTHTTYSDGELTPTELIDYASQRGVVAISITDHDTVSAYAEPSLFDHANSQGVEIVPGVEVSTGIGDQRYHVLGLCIDPAEPELTHWLKGLRDSRDEHLKSVVDLLLSHDWSVDRFVTQAGQAFTQAHIAQAVVGDANNRSRLETEFGDVPNQGQFIERYMVPGGEFFVPRTKPTPSEAVDTIHKAGGLAFLAHPVAYRYEQGLSYEDIATELHSSGYDGIEAIYYYFHKSGGDREIDEIDDFTEIALDQELLVSGGSDYHGASLPIGNYMDVGYREKRVYPTLALLRSIQRAAEERRSRS
jgi:hypothetical protein